MKLINEKAEIISVDKSNAIVIVYTKIINKKTFEFINNNNINILNNDLTLIYNNQISNLIKKL